MGEGKINLMIDFAKIEHIFAADKSIHCVELVDFVGNTIINKTIAEISSEKGNTKLDSFKVDLYIMKNILDLANHSYGKTISLRVKRESTQQIVYYLENYILYVTYESGANEADRKILDKIEECIKGVVVEI